MSGEHMTVGKRPTIFREPVGAGRLSYFVYVDGIKVSIDENIALIGQRVGQCSIRTPDDHRQARKLRQKGPGGR